MTDASPVPVRPAPAASLPRPLLAIRLAWLTVAVILLTEAVFVTPSLVRQRQDWLGHRLTEAQLAAFAASAMPGGLADPAKRDELLRLAGAEAISLQRPGQPTAILSPAEDLPASTSLDPAQESFAEALAATASILFGATDRRISVMGTSQLSEGAHIIVVLQEQHLREALLRQARRVGGILLAVAVAAGLLLYAALLVLLVRPMRRLTHSIAAFRADPEHATPLDESRFSQRRQDEIATAARELAAMQRELRAALWRNARLAALGTAMAKVNHDLRGILSPAMLTAERLQMSRDPSVKRAGDVLVRAVERAADLTRRTLEFAGETPFSLPRERLVLRRTVDDAMEQARAACPALLVTNHVVPEIEIEADRESMVRVLGNLLRNAGEASAVRASVNATHEGEELVIIIADDGPGLPEAVRAALFRPFVSGARRGSTGLGLAIVHDLIRAHGGEVVLLDTGPTGTRFRLTLPRRGIHTAVAAN